MPKRGSDGYYREDIELVRGADGERKRKTIRAKTLKEFNKKIDEAKRLYSKGVSLEDITVQEWGERWLRIYKGKETDERKGFYESKMRLDINPVIGNMRMKDVRASHLQELLNNAGEAKSTVAKIRGVIQQLFEAADSEGIIERYPARKLVLPSHLKEELRRPLTSFECNIVCRVAQSHAAGVYVLTMLLCGLRRGECAGLKMSHVDLNKKRISVEETITYTMSNQGEEGGTKTEAGVRQMPIPDILFPFLSAWCVGKKSDDYVFTKVDGTHMTETKVRRWWESFHNQCHRAAGAKTYRNKLLIETSPFDKDISPHYLRHTYSTDIHAAGVHEREQLYFMGHKSQKVTDRYRAVSDDSFARAAEQINQFFNVKYASLCPATIE